MDFVTFCEVARFLGPEISVIMRGRHGIGKTEQVRQLSKKEFNLPLIERRLSQLTEGDLIGLPFKQDNKITKFLPPDWFYNATEKPHMIFLDEFDRSSHEVQQAAMELILDRSIQGTKIHKDCRVYAAINGGKHGSMYNVNQIDLALNDRFWIADIEPSVQEWINWAQTDGEVLPEIVDFITEFDIHLEKKEMAQDNHTITPSRRSWKRLSDTLKNNPHIIEDMRSEKSSNVFISLCIGFVGHDATASFKENIISKSKISFDDVINNFDKHKEKINKLDISKKNYIIEKTFQNSIDKKEKAWSKEQMQNIFKFFQTLPSEAKISMWDKLTESDCKMENSKPFAEMVAPIILDLV
jgi:MoxR-like ATPase